MIEALSASLKNVVYFKEANVDYINNNGLVVVSGSNLDSKISKKQNNGAGKSLLFSVIPNVVYESTPLAAQKRSRKDILGKGSETSFTIKGNDGHTYTVIQTSSKYVILRDGEDVQARTLNIQREWIQKIFPISEDEFYSYVYLQSQRNLEFQVGTPRSRLSYITNVWRLDQYDVMRKYFEKRLSDVKTAKTEFDVLSSQLIQLNKSLDKLNWTKEKQQELSSAKETVESLSDTVKGLQARAAKLRAQKEQADFYRTTKAKIAKVKKKVRYTKAELREQAQLIQEVSQYGHALENYQHLTKRWSAKIEALGECNFDDVKKAKLQTMLKRSEEYSDRFAEMGDIRQKVLELEEALSEIPEINTSELKPYLLMAKKAGRDLLEILDEELGILNSTLALESLMREHEDGECPTCRQKVDVKKLKKSIEAAKTKKVELRSAVKAHKANVERTRLKKKLESFEFDAAAYSELKEKIQKTALTIEKLAEEKERARRYSEYKEELDSIKKPKQPKEKPSITYEELDEQLEFISELRRLTERLEEFEEEPKDDGLEELKKVEKKLLRIESEYSEAFSVAVALGNKRSEVKLLQKQVAELTIQLDGMKPLIEQGDMLKTLTLAYSNKGLKLHAVNEVVLQLEQNLNRFATLIFAEPFKFEVLTKDDGIHVNVDRGHNKVSDIRQLSGAESDSFRLLYLLASLVMVEDSRRTNFVVLDEPDSHMDDVTRTLFIERYIPFLRTMVPHIFLITPNSKHLYSNCDHLTVVKKNGVSKVA